MGQGMWEDSVLTFPEEMLRNIHSSKIRLLSTTKVRIPPKSSLVNQSVC